MKNILVDNMSVTLESYKSYLILIALALVILSVCGKRRQPKPKTCVKRIEGILNLTTSSLTARLNEPYQKELETLILMMQNQSGIRYDGLNPAQQGILAFFIANFIKQRGLIYSRTELQNELAPNGYHLLHYHMLNFFFMKKSGSVCSLKVHELKSSMRETVFELVREARDSEELLLSEVLDDDDSRRPYNLRSG